MGAIMRDDLPRGDREQLLEERDQEGGGRVEDLERSDRPSKGAERRAGLRPDERDPDEPPRAPGSAGGEENMSGTPDGGTAFGGMGGTNAGAGTFNEEAAEQIGNAYGDGSYDDLGGRHDDGDVDMSTAVGVDDAEKIRPEEGPYAGPSGGAVGGTPAEGRAEGGKTGRGIAPGGSKRGDSTIGGDPNSKSDDRQS